MSLNYKADCVTLPSLRGVNGATSGPGAYATANVTASSQNLTFNDALIGHWVTIRAEGSKVYVVAGAVGDTVTATTAHRPLSDGQEVDFLVTKNTQKLGFIGTGSVSDGLRYWVSTTPGAV